MTHAACGGVTLFALASEEDGGVMTVAWGQNAANGAFSAQRFLPSGY
jgi:hypothetical protein